MGVYVISLLSSTLRKINYNLIGSYSGYVIYFVIVDLCIRVEYPSFTLYFVCLDQKKKKKTCIHLYISLNATHYFFL